MKKLVLAVGAALALLTAPLTANAIVFQFNAAIDGSNEVPNGSGSSATGIATLFYNDFGTVTVSDDNYDFSMSVFALSGPATAYHIHGPASTLQNAPVRVGLDSVPFVALNVGGTLLVGGNDVSPPAFIPAFNAYPQMSFLQMLQGGLAYVNVHTASFPSGEVRGQLIQVAAVAAAVPEPQTYAMLLAGLGLIAGVAVRRSKQRLP